GWVGEPLLFFRASPNMRGDVHVGAQAGIGFPGDQVPSIEFAATTPEVSAFATYAPSSTPLALSALVGFRLDRGAHAIADVDRLTRSQRLAIGVSDTNELLLGIGFAARVARD